MIWDGLYQLSGWLALGTVSVAVLFGIVLLWQSRHTPEAHRSLIAYVTLALVFVLVARLLIQFGAAGQFPRAVRFATRLADLAVAFAALATLVTVAPVHRWWWGWRNDRVGNRRRNRGHSDDRRGDSDRAAVVASVLADVRRSREGAA